MSPSELLTKYRYLYEKFNRDEYPVYFSKYMSEIRPYFDGLAESGATDIPSEARQVIKEVSDNAAQFRWRHRREAAIENDKIVLLLFLAPAAAELGTPESVRFAGELAEAWNESFPDSPFKVGNYKDIVEGFKWKIGFDL